ncbi:MAG: DUF1553 domain-containing protein [Rubripirellula sp.]
MGSPAEANPPDSIEFFENRIRPALVQHCYECHSADSEEVGGSLLLDSSGGMMTGGDSGPAIKPGSSSASLLISALKYESTEMPPDGKLPSEVIEAFEQWIEAGAVDPRTSATSTVPARSRIDIDQGREFWAFRPLSISPAPTSTGLPSSGRMDEFINRSLDDASLFPNQTATPEVRLRRLAFDLTGLPPSLELQQTWMSDPTERRWRSIVDDLLASPEYGQHWARHWMDVARYSDSNGSDFNATHHEAWRYREYLIDSFASDRPFDKMVRQQIAGDLLPAASDDERFDNLVASTFLMIGTKMLSERDKEKLALDVVDEQIDTVGRAFLGLTLGCARCHDHKFDPVPTEDYYALAGIFKSTVTLKGESQKYVSTWNVASLPTSQQHREEVETYQKESKRLQTLVEQAESALKAAKSRSSLPGVVVDQSDADTAGMWRSSTYYKRFVGAGYIHDDNGAKGELSIRFSTRLPEAGRYEVRYAHSPGSNRASTVPVTIVTADGEKKLVLDQRSAAIDEIWSSLGTFEFSAEADAVVTVSNEGTSGYVIADAVQFLPESLSDLKAKPEENAKALKVVEQQLKERKKELAEWKSSTPAPLPEAMAPSDHATDKLADSPVHIRGEVKNLGKVVPRGFLQVCSPGDATIDKPKGSGRLELANWLTDPDNPLVARVFVNRVWMHLMGEGIVRTVDNFGLQGERPTHPELLDHLATEFVRGGWRVKPLVREIVLSRAYNRSGDYRDQAASIDPENRLLWRAHRKRIPAEALRDGMLVSADTLVREPKFAPMKGRGTLVSSNSANSAAKFDDIAQPTRSVYLPIVRGYVPPLMGSLDGADPDMLVGKRPTTNVPGQALVLINSPDVNRWAELTAKRVLASTHDYEGRLDLLFRLCLQRSPNVDDREIAAAHFQGRKESIDAWHQFVAAIFAGTEFRLLD